MRRLAIAVCLLFAAAPWARAQDGESEVPEPTGPLTRVITVEHALTEKPLAGVSVEAWGAPGGKRVATTGADGVVRFENLPRKDVVYVARKPGFRCGWHEPGRRWWSVPEEDGDPDGDGETSFRLLLRPGSVVEGAVVMKNDGAPIAGAIVEAWERATATDQWELDGAPLWTATTDANGRFHTRSHWPALTEGQSPPHVEATIIARKPGWIREFAEVTYEDAGKQAPLAFELLPAVEIHGAVTDAAGLPAAGALVHAYPPDHWAFTADRRERRDTRETHPREMTVRADARGRYSLPEATPGVPYHVWAEKEVLDEDGWPDAVSERSAVVDEVGAALGGTGSCDLRLRRLGTLRVRLAPDAGGSQESAYIELKPPRDARPWAYDREEDGYEVVEEADPGVWIVHASADGWTDESFRVPVEAGEEKVVELRLSRGNAIEGLVVDDRGEPVGDARLTAYIVDPDDPGRHLDDEYESATSDEAGRFVLSGLPSGAIDVLASHEDLRADGMTRITAPAKHVRVVLNRKARVRFHVTVPGGASAPERIRLTVTHLSGESRGQQLQQELERASDGTFAIELDVPGPKWFGVEADGFAPLVERVEVAPGKLNAPGPFALSLGLTLRGRVVDASGSPIAGARVLAWGNEEKAVTTSSRGAFEVPHLAPGKVDLSITAPGMAESLLSPTVADGGTTQQFVLTPGGLVTGTVVDDDGRRPPYSIDVFPASSKGDYGSRWRVVLHDGAISVRLPPGRYRVPLRTAGKPGPTTFEVTEGGEVVLELRSR